MAFETVEELWDTIKALAHARARADVVAPLSDGHIGAVCDSLDTHWFTDVAIVAYMANYASAYYGPFHVVLDSAPRESSNALTKRTYRARPMGKKP